MRVITLDVLLFPELRRTEVVHRAVLGVREVALGQRRAVVRRLGFAADQQDRAVAVLAQVAGAVARGEASADQQMVNVAVGHRLG